MAGCKELMEDVIGCNLDVENVLSLALLASQHEVTDTLQLCTYFIRHLDSPNTAGILFVILKISLRFFHTRNITRLRKKFMAYMEPMF